MNDFTLPDEVTKLNLRAHGDAGRAWLDALPRIVAELCERWLLTDLGPPYEGGAVAFVAPASRADGEQVVLKVSFVDEETQYEADALAAWGGDGAVRLLDADLSQGALILERIEPGTLLGDLPDRNEVIAIACALLRRLQRPLSGHHPFMSVQAFAERLVEELPARFKRAGRPFEEHLVSEAVATCERLAVARVPPVLVNRDYHPWNVLAAEREPWLAIDPKPLAGEPAFDTGHFLRSLLPDDDLDIGVIEHLIETVADELGLNPERMRAWAFVRSVDDAIWWRATGGEDIERDVTCAQILSEELRRELL